MDSTGEEFKRTQWGRLVSVPQCWGLSRNGSTRLVTGVIGRFLDASVWQLMSSVGWGLQFLSM